MRALVRRVLADNPRWVVAFFALVFVAGTVRFWTAERADGSPQYRIGVDGRYYWAYLTSMVLDRDLDFSNQYANKESGNYYQYTKTSTGRMANPFTIGPAIMWMPFFVVAHGVALIAHGNGADGTTHIEQGVTLYSSFLYVFAAMLLVYAMARRRWGPLPAVCGAFVAIACGPLLHYTLNQPYYAHAPSAFATTLFLYVWDTTRASRTRKTWIALGAILGLAMLVRTPNVVFGLPLAVEAIALAVKSRNPRALIDPLLGALAVVVVFTPQMIAWHVLYGHALGVPQGPGYMRWTQPLWADTLFSSRNGLFPYAPLWALGLLGLVAFTAREKALGAVLWTTLILTAYLNGASSDWSGGGAFGGRRYDGMVVHVALGTAFVVQWVVAFVERRPRVAAAIGLAVMGLAFVTCNSLMADDFRFNRLNPSASKDMLATYNGEEMQVARPIFGAGNPLSWPAAWAFAWRTGAPSSRYDEVIGTYFLTDFHLERYRTASNAKLKDTLKFGAAGHAKYLVGDWGAPAADTTRPAGARARALVPLNDVGAVAFHLVGTGVTPCTLRVLWNGSEVARADLTAVAPFDVPFTIPADRVQRDVNLVDLVHDGLPSGQTAASYARLDMAEVQ